MPNNAKEKVLLSWSGGKDSMLALHEQRRNKKYEIVALLTTICEDYDRISIHGVRRVLLEKQADMLDLPLEKVLISKNESDKQYELKMQSILAKYQNIDVTSVVFGDICLEGIRHYREKNLSKIGMKGIFPLWKRSTIELAYKFINSGYKAIVTCVDSKFLGRKFAGRFFDNKFITELDPTIDPCGENGEFHTFTYDGPLFSKNVPHTAGNIIFKENRFYYFDLQPA